MEATAPVKPEPALGATPGAGESDSGLWSAQTWVEAQAFAANLERTASAAVALAHCEAQLFTIAAKRMLVWLPVLVFLAMSLWAVLILGLLYAVYYFSGLPWLAFTVVIVLHLALIGTGVRVLQYWLEQGSFRRLRVHLKNWRA